MASQLAVIAQEKDGWDLLTMIVERRVCGDSAHVKELGRLMTTSQQQQLLESKTVEAPLSHAHVFPRGHCKMNSLMQPVSLQ